ncbi:MAG: DNA adenine methylase [Acidimicrobiales bacterium]
MIKYLGSKRRLIPALTEIFASCRPRTALDLFTGTTRVAQALKSIGADVTAVDSARYAHVLAQCFIATDATVVDHGALADEIARLNALPAVPGYITETFCTQARYFQPRNGARIDAIREAIARDHAGTWMEPVLLTALMLAADRVDSTTGVQMAYLKQWAQRAERVLELRVPELTAGSGTALHGDASELVGTLGPFDVAYLDPPYNHHRYTANYHVWETLVADDQPDSYGVARKRVDLRSPDGRSVFNDRRLMPDALAKVIATVAASVVVLSYNDESWISLDELVDMCAVRGEVRSVAFESKRYVGAQIGIHNPSGVKVGTPGRLRNQEYVLVCGDLPAVG